MNRILSHRRVLLGIVFVTSLFGVLIALSGQSREASTTPPVDPSPPQPEDTSIVVQLELPSEEVPLDGEGIIDEEIDESAWVHSGNPDRIPLLVRYLKSDEEIGQLAALAEFAGMGAKAKKAVPAIVEALQDPKSSIRLQAAVTLIHMNVQAKAAIRTLAAELRSEEEAARKAAAHAIDMLVNSPEIFGTSCWGPDPPPRIARPWVRKAVEQAIKQD